MIARTAAALALTALLLAGPARAEGGEGYASLDMAAVEQMLGAPDVRVYDANTRDLFEKHHLPGAVFIGHEQDLARVLPPDRSTRLVFYCSNPK